MRNIPKEDRNAQASPPNMESEIHVKQQAEGRRLNRPQ